MNIILKKRNGFISIVLVLALVFSMALPAFSADNSTKTVYPIPVMYVNADISNEISIVALGDSVPAYYGVKENEGYVSQLSELLTLAGISNTVKNLAVSGNTSSSLLTQLAKPEVLADISKADVITLNIGGNDLLSPLLGLLSANLSIVTANPGLVSSLVSSNKNMLIEEVTEFSKTFSKIIKTINEAAPDAVIVVSNVYNFVPKTFILYEAADELIRLINEVIAGSSQLGCVVVDTYTALSQSKETVFNFDLENGILDPHPTAKGHEIMAKIHAEALASVIEPAEKIDKADNADKIEKAEEVVPITLTREEIMVELIKLISTFFEFTLPPAIPFDDISSDSDSFSYISTARALGLTNGVGSNCFDPHSIMTRQDLAVISMRIVYMLTSVPIEEFAVIENEFIADMASASEYARVSINAAAAFGIFEIDSNGNIDPKGAVTSTDLNTLISTLIIIIML